MSFQPAQYLHIKPPDAQVKQVTASQMIAMMISVPVFQVNRPSVQRSGPAGIYTRLFNC